MAQSTFSVGGDNAEKNVSPKLVAPLEYAIHQREGMAECERAKSIALRALHSSYFFDSREMQNVKRSADKCEISFQLLRTA